MDVCFLPGMMDSIRSSQVGFEGFCFITTPSRIPSVPKLPENSWGSTGPGNWNMTVKGPDGHRFWVCITNAWENRKTLFSPVTVSPFISTLPSLSTSHWNAPALEEIWHVSWDKVSQKQNPKNFRFRGGTKARVIESSIWKGKSTSDLIR